ncbi:MAG: hypothetical protein RQ724_05785 [Desulfuromonadales bacterium]|nr:hypothetical protein [Desulfuromonadales bacterium]
MTDQPDNDPNPPGGDQEKPSRCADLEVLKQEVEHRLRDNRRFLDRFLDEDFVDEDERIEDEGDADFEEL